MKKKSPYPYAIKILKQALATYTSLRKQSYVTVKVWKSERLIKNETKLIKKYDDRIHQLKTAIQNL